MESVESFPGDRSTITTTISEKIEVDLTDALTAAEGNFFLLWQCCCPLKLCYSLLMFFFQRPLLLQVKF